MIHRLILCTHILCLPLIYPWWVQANSVSPPCSEKDFPKVYRVFKSVYICAGKGVSEDKIAHAVHVTAEWLDNDDDGTADAPEVINALLKYQAIVALTQNGLGFFASRRLRTYWYQDLYAHETNPTNGMRDASQEEIHHLIINAGWAIAYPQIFADNKNSIMYQIYDQAERKGYYTYDDPTCGKACKSTEFHYLGMASYLGATADLFSDEMRIKTRTELQQKIPEFIKVIENPEYNYPKHKWPTGTYTHEQNIIQLR